MTAKGDVALNRQRRNATCGAGALLAGTCACTLIAALPQRTAPSQAPPRIPITRRIFIPDGERLEYSATWRLWHAGHASLALGHDGPEQQISFRADSTGVASVLFPVHDHIRSRYEPISFCATSLVKDTLEGRRKRHTEIRYDAAHAQLALDEDNLETTPPVSKHEVKSTPGCVLELFSALYYVRSLPLVVGEVYNFPVNDGGNTVEVQLVPDLKETITTPAGSYQAIRTEPKVFNNVVFQRHGRMWLWFSDDGRHLPVMLKAKVLWGTVTAVLVKVSKAGTPPPAASPSAN